MNDDDHVPKRVLPETAVAEQRASYQRLLDSLGNGSRAETKAFLEARPADPLANEVSEESAALFKQKSRKHRVNS